jgi:hypothetical protein
VHYASYHLPPFYELRVAGGKFALMSRKHFLLFYFSVSALLVASCNETTTSDDTLNRSQRDSAIQRRVLQVRADSAQKLKKAISYNSTVVTASVLDSIRTTYGKNESTWNGYRAFTTINRKDVHYVRIGDTVLLPSSIEEDTRQYSVFPWFYAEAASIPKIILISNKWQSYACYEHGVLVRFAACNSGEERKPTLPGRYAVNWKSKLRLSSLDSTWRLPFTVNFHLQAGSAFHQFDMPGRPVSHSCVRQFLKDAEWLFRWVRVAALDSAKRFVPFTGTPVLIIDVFDFSRKRGGPWMELVNNEPAIQELPTTPMAVEEALIPMSQIPKDVRGSLRDRNKYLTADSVLKARGVIRQHVVLRESINYNKLRAERRKRAAKAKASATQVE